MKKITILGISIFSFFLTAHLAFADVIFNEVQLSPTGERFIELYNSGSSSINLTDWSIKRKTASGTEYSLVSASRFENKSISAGSYFLLANEYDYTGSVIPDVTWAKSYSIANDNTIFLYNQKDIINKIGWGEASDCDGDCAPNPTNGKSIQKTSGGSWVVSTPTPGEINSSGNDSSSDSVSDSSSSNNSDTTTETETKEPEVYKITTKILISKVLVAGISFPVNSLTTDSKKQTFLVGKYVWNFGDGTRKEEQGANISEYTYQYPGEYILTLDYYENYSIFTPAPDATNRITVKVVPSDVYISSVGSGIDSYIEIENKSKYEVTLSNWILKGINKFFIIPKGTIVLSGKKIRLSPKITNFNNFDIQNLSLVYPSGEVISQYPVVENKVLASKISANYYPTSSTSGNTNTSNQNDSNIINLNDLGASAESAKEIPSNSTFAYLGLAVILVLGGGAVYFARRGSFIKNDDLENTIRAEDMTIME